MKNKKETKHKWDLPQALLLRTWSQSSIPQIGKSRVFLPRVSYGDFSSLQFVALTRVFLWLTRNQRLESFDQDGEKFETRFLKPGFLIETLTIDRVWFLLQHTIELNTVCVLQIARRLLITFQFSDPEADESRRPRNQNSYKYMNKLLKFDWFFRKQMSGQTPKMKYFEKIQPNTRLLLLFFNLIFSFSSENYKIPGKIILCGRLKSNKSKLQSYPFQILAPEQYIKFRFGTHTITLLRFQTI